jgi:hypothetical protein
VGSCLGHGGQEAERAYLLWKARQVADQQGSGAVAVEGGQEGEEGEEGKALVDFAVHGLKGDLFPDLMEYDGVRGAWGALDRWGHGRALCRRLVGVRGGVGKR